MNVHWPESALTETDCKAGEFMVAHRLANADELHATLTERRAVVYVTVEWAVQERRSREVLLKFIDLIDSMYLYLSITVYMLGEECEGISDWWNGLNLPGMAGTGYGAVIWLEDGEFRDLVEYAASIGTSGLIERTLDLWQA